VIKFPNGKVRSRFLKLAGGVQSALIIIIWWLESECFKLSEKRELNYRSEIFRSVGVHSQIDSTK